MVDPPRVWRAGPGGRPGAGHGLGAAQTPAVPRARGHRGLRAGRPLGRAGAGGSAARRRGSADRHGAHSAGCRSSGLAAQSADAGDRGVAARHAAAGSRFAGADRAGAVQALSENRAGALRQAQGGGRLRGRRSFPAARRLPQPARGRRRSLGRTERTRAPDVPAPFPPLLGSRTPPHAPCPGGGGADRPR